MNRITDDLLERLEINGKSIRESKLLDEPAYEEITQLRIPICDVPIV